MPPFRLIQLTVSGSPILPWKLQTEPDPNVDTKSSLIANT
jgi:hypothetical protein